jgi:CO/xanthine dehydrogenase FAD-binding subunit
MEENHSKIYSPASLQDLFIFMSHNRQAVLYPSFVKKIKAQRERRFVLPQTIVTLEKIEELKRIGRTERYLELGSMVELNKILLLGGNIPDVLSSFLSLCENQSMRNIETLLSALFPEEVSASSSVEEGRNDPLNSSFLAVSGALFALGANYELRSASSSRWVSASRFLTDRRSLAKSGEILVRVRIPFGKWDWTLCRRFAAYDKQKQEEGFAAFMARIQNDTLNEVRVILSGEDLLRDAGGEHLLAGKKLPLSDEDAASYTAMWKSYLEASQKISAFLRKRFLNFIQEAVSNFRER